MLTASTPAIHGDVVTVLALAAAILAPASHLVTMGWKNYEVSLPALAMADFLPFRLPIDIHVPHFFYKFFCIFLPL